MGKVVTKETFSEIRKELKQNNRKIVLCHGVFDLIHLGHILHFEEAKSLADVLVVSVTSEKYVRKGPERPYFNDELRLKFLAALECIDYVMLSEGYIVDDIIETVEPDLYIKGQEDAKFLTLNCQTNSSNYSNLKSEEETIGAGDAFFSLASLCAVVHASPEVGAWEI